MHAEATSEKMAMGHFLDGEVVAVVGTHTHVQTADEQILPKGTAYITDIGMTGPLHSVIGVKKELAIEKFLTAMPRRFEVASGPSVFCAVLLELDPRLARRSRLNAFASSIRRLSRIFLVFSASPLPLCCSETSVHRLGTDCHGSGFP